MFVTAKSKIDTNAVGVECVFELFNPSGIVVLRGILIITNI